MEPIRKMKFIALTKKKKNTQESKGWKHCDFKSHLGYDSVEKKIPSTNRIIYKTNGMQM